MLMMISTNATTASRVLVNDFGSGSSRTITARATNGTFPLTSIDIPVDGRSIKSESTGSGGSVSVDIRISSPGQHSVQVVARDEGYYTASDSSSW